MLLRYRDQISALLENYSASESRPRRRPSPPPRHSVFSAQFSPPEPGLSKRRKTTSLMMLKREDQQIFQTVVKTEGPQQFCAVPKKEEDEFSALCAVPKEEDIVEVKTEPVKQEVWTKEEPGARFFSEYASVLARMLSRMPCRQFIQRAETTHRNGRRRLPN